MRIDLGDGADRGSFGFMIPAGRAFEIDGGPGADLLTAPRNGVGAATLDGGDGDDDLRSEETADTLLGGTGNDKLSAGKGADVLHGGDGNDLLRDDDGATPAGDLLDGGSGFEKFDVGAVRTFAGDDADNDFTAPEVGSAVRLSGAGGNDKLTATDAHGDIVDGGGGDDAISGGFGDDTLVGGPGRDQIAGDRQARCNELHCDFMDGFGNDTIDARDGEPDSVQCGPGTDTVRADPQDLVADDCEHVDRGAVAAKAKLTTVGSLRLRDVLRHGLRVRVPARATVTARLGKTIVARGKGAGVVRLKLTARGRKALEHRRRAVLTIAAGKLRATVRLR